MLTYTHLVQEAMQPRELIFDPQLKKYRILFAAIFILMYVIVPFSAMKIKTYDREDCVNNNRCYEFEVEVIELLNVSRNENNTSIIYGAYFLVKNIAGGPAMRFVLFDPNYETDEQLPDHFIGYGSLMDPETYYGDQYIFYENYIEIYLKKIKTGIFWDEEARDLIWMYSNPINPFNSIITLLIAVLIPENGLYGIDEFLVVFWSFITLVIQIISITWFIRAIKHNTYSKDQLLLFVSGYLVVCVLLIIPILSIINARPF